MQACFTPRTVLKVDVIINARMQGCRLHSDFGGAIPMVSIKKNEYLKHAVKYKHTSNSIHAVKH